MLPHFLFIFCPVPQEACEIDAAIGFEANPFRFQQRPLLRPPGCGTAETVDHTVAGVAAVLLGTTERVTDKARAAAKPRQHRHADSRQHKIDQLAGRAPHRAEQRARQMMSQEEVYTMAQQEADTMIKNAQQKIKDLKQVTNEFVDDALSRTESAISTALEEIRQSRKSFQAVVNPQQPKASPIIEDV